MSTVSRTAWLALLAALLMVLTAACSGQDVAEEAPPEHAAVVNLTCTVPREGESWDDQLTFQNEDETQNLPYGCIGPMTIELGPETGAKVIRVDFPDGSYEELTYASRPTLELDGREMDITPEITITTLCPRGAC